jgi:hypothetical protein
MNTDILFDESLSPDTRLMKFAHECIRAFRGQEPPYDALEVEFLVFCLRSALQAQRERDAQWLEGRAEHMDQGEPGSPARWMTRIFRDEAQALRAQS